MSEQTVRQESQTVRESFYQAAVGRSDLMQSVAAMSFVLCASVFVGALIVVVLRGKKSAAHASMLPFADAEKGSIS